MQRPDLTDPQKDLVFTPGSLFAEACPGAGKTRAIVARFLHRTGKEPRKGIALLSFTNAAIDEVRRRCGESPDVLLAPHFVGTFDGFINRFITGPLYVRDYENTPRFIDSWSGLPSGRFRIRHMDRLPNLELDWFEFDHLLRASLRGVPPRYERILAPFLETHRKELETAATFRCRALVNKGVISCAASRALAAYYLGREGDRQLMGTLLTSRFSEVIVDETQDCGPEELTVLMLLRDVGVSIVAVADLDQSIFEFRRADPADVRTFVYSLAVGPVLNGNFRSTPAICAINRSLRLSHRSETASGENASLSTRVQLMGYREASRLTGRIEALLTAHSLTRREVIFLAHRMSDARRCTGVPEAGVGGTNRVLEIAWAHSVLKARSSSGTQRLQAIQLIERTLRALVQTDDRDDEMHREALDERWLRDAAIRLGIGLAPAHKSAKSYAAEIRQYVENMDWPAGTALKLNLGTLIKAPKEKEWLGVGAEQSTRFASATIHSVKGQELPCVVLVLPANPPKEINGYHAVDHWEREMSSELRRVLYVGASRAQKLLILAVHNNHLLRVAKILERDEVPYELHE